MNIIRIVFFVLFVTLNTSNLHAASIWARGDNADVFLQNTQKGNALKKYWKMEHPDSYVLESNIPGTSQTIGNESAWKSTIGYDVKKRNTLVRFGQAFPYVLWQHATLQQYQYLGFIIHVTQACVPISNWVARDKVIHSNININNYYRPGRVIGYFPNPDLHMDQDLSTVHLGIFLKYELRNNNLGFWIADQGWNNSDNRIRKHFISSGGHGKHNANNYRVVEYVNGC